MLFELLVSFFFCLIIQESVVAASKRPNIIILLADDLGYGDLSFSPFNSPEMSAVVTPNLRKMAADGVTLSNFHAASPVCSPSRAAIMVGLFPWRIGVDFIYAGDLKKDGSQEMDHEQLPLIPNIAMSFRDAGYYTAHIGKWHLGGQSHIDIPKRRDSNFTGLSCATPGINQYGFHEYVGMSEGTGSARYHTHQAKNTYHTGSKYLVRNDVPLPIRKNEEILTDRQTEEAMRVIREQNTKQQPFFLNLWFDAPHSPWESMEPYYTQLNGKFKTSMLQRYGSMISNMDMNIGRLLSLLDELAIASNTLVVFSSDNGPENDAGYTGPFKGRKRLLSEGGIRVPTIVQWKGHIASGVVNDLFAVNTDLYPTLTEAAGIELPMHNRIDGVSFLPLILQPTSDTAVMTTSIPKDVLDHTRMVKGDERTVLWYTHSIGYPRLTAAWSHGLKVLWNDYEGRLAKKLPPAFRMFDMRRDSAEDVNLIPQLLTECSSYLSAERSASMTWLKVSTALNLKEGMKDPLYRKAALQVLNHLHIKMHLFRHEAEVDWSRYHSNKPYETAPHCGIRSAIEVDALPLSNRMVQLPEFCGADVYDEFKDSTCRCTAQQCVNHWSTGSLDTHRAQFSYLLPKGQSIQRGLSIVSAETGTLSNYTLKELVEWTEFVPICIGDTLSSSTQSTLSRKYADMMACGHKHGTTESFISIKTVEKKSSKSSKKTADKLSVIDTFTPVNGGWSRGSSSSSGSSAQSCHQRLSRQSNGLVRLLPNHCGDDVPVLTVSIHSMIPDYLSVCPESMSHLTNERGGATVSVEQYLDDNVMIVALNVLLLYKGDVIQKGVTKGDEMTDSSNAASEVVDHSTAIVDPLFFHSLDLEYLNISESVLYSTYSADSTSIHSDVLQRIIEEQFGFIRYFERRLLRVADTTRVHALNQLVFPVYIYGVWSVAVLVDIQTSTPSIIYYNPVETKDRPSLLSTFLQHVVSIVLNKVHHRTADGLLSMTRITSNARHPKSESGLRVLGFLRKLKSHFNKPKGSSISGSAISQEIVAVNVEKERKQLVHYIVHKGKKDYHDRKKYVKSMSGRKFTPSN